MAIPPLVDLIEARLHLGGQAEPARERRGDLARRGARVATLEPPGRQKPLRRALRGELRSRDRDVLRRAARPFEAVAAGHLLHEPEERAIVAAEQHRGLVGVAGAAHRPQQRDVVRRRALRRRQLELVAQPRRDDRVAQRLLERLVVAHVAASDTAARTSARRTVGGATTRSAGVTRRRYRAARGTRAEKGILPRRPMRPSTLPLLRCPRCRADASLALTPRASDEREVREGELVCERCAATFAVDGGIAHLLHARRTS